MEKSDKITDQVAALTHALNNHQVYDLMNTLNDVREFMEQEALIAWGYMSLLKALQLQLTGTAVPWMPSANATVCRFINETVLNEESDFNLEHRPQSSFEMFLESMLELEADVFAITGFMHEAHNLESLFLTLKHEKLSQPVRDFLEHTFNLIEENKPHAIASALAYGRAGFAPDRLKAVVEQADEQSRKNFPRLLHFLQRRLEKDTAMHQHQAREMVDTLCGGNELKWQEAERAAVQSLERRKTQLDGLATQLQKQSAGQLSGF